MMRSPLSAPCRRSRRQRRRPPTGSHKKKNPPNAAHEGSIGRRPLSSFVNRAADDHTIDNQSDGDHTLAAPSRTDSEFAPQTSIAAFRWPSVCRAAWRRSAAEYQRVADLVLKQSASDRRLVGIAGLRPGDGCTTTLLCLAAAVAGPDRRVILLDANFRSPQLAVQLGVDPVAGWQDVLAHGLSVEEAVIHAQSDCVDLLPLDARNLDGPQLAAGVQPSITAGVLRYAYDVVLLDLGAILAPSSFATTVHLLRNMAIDSASWSPTGAIRTKAIYRWPPSCSRRTAVSRSASSKTEPLERHRTLSPTNLRTLAFDVPNVPRLLATERAAL